MSIDNSTPIKNNNRKKRNNDMEIKVDAEESKMFSDNHIFIIQKPSLKFPKAKYICKICPYHIADKDKALKHCNEIMHKKNIKRTSTRNMMQFLNEPTVNQLDVINECLIETLKLDIFISESESNRRKSLCNEMNMIASEFGSRLYICGSLVTNLSMISSSDVNLYLDLSTNNSTSISYLSQLEKLSNAFSEKLQLNTEIKLDKINCGLFCKDSIGIVYHISSITRMCQLTSELIAVYMRIDSRAEQLIKLFRYFAREAFIDRSIDGLFPAHVFHLMVVFYLQQLSSPILPNLHKLADTNPDIDANTLTSVMVNDIQVQYVSDLAAIKRLWCPPANVSSLSQLWLGLLRFYAIDFDINTYMVSVRCSEPVLKIDRNIVNKRLAVDDPFDAKRNLLFSYNAPDVVDFFNDQLQGCYIYFAIAQLPSGPAFSKVTFSEMSMQTMPTTCLCTPVFTNQDFKVAIDMLECEFQRIYENEAAFYDVSKWPVRLLVKLCLTSILTTVFDSRREIASFVSLLDFKGSSYFPVGNYTQFKEQALHLAMCVFRDFSDYFEATGSWTSSDVNSKDAFDVIKKATHRFITESLNITMNDDDNENDDEEFEMHDTDSNEVDIEEIMEDLGITVEDDNDEPDTPKANIEETDEIMSDDSSNLESWKIPISFKLIHIPIKGVLESSNEVDVYNEHRVQSIPKEQLEYSFEKIPIQKTKLEIICPLCNEKGHRKECCKEAVPRFEDLRHSLRDVLPEWLQVLREVLINKFNSTLPSPERLQKHKIIFEHVNKIIQNLYPNVRPQMFGSSHNGFMTRASDIDICLEFFQDDKRQNLSNKEITTRLKNIGRDIKKFCPNIDVSYVLKAKVPIIKFFSKDGTQGDISINNSLAIQNTKMLKLYAELYPNMKGLGNLLKFISKSCEIGDASQGTLSSYAYIVMLIHFLQKRGLLPVLQELYEGKTKPNHVIDNWDAWYQNKMEMIFKLWKPKTNIMPFEYLWLDFFYYYAVEFDIDREVISIKQSKPLYKIDKSWQMSYMAIEDPFDLNHNLSGSLSLDKCRYILQCFAHVLKLHSNNDNLSRAVNTHHLLMEPSILRPAFSNTSRTCFKCNKQGHVARDCPENQYYRHSMGRNGITVQKDLPNLSSPFHFKESTNPNRFYVKLDTQESASNVSMPLKTFNGGMNDYSVVPISLTFGDKSIVIPMLMGKDNNIYDKFNSVFKNEHQQMPVSFPIELLTSNNRVPEVLQRAPNVIVPNNNVPLNNVPMNTMPSSSALSNNNLKKPANKKLPSPMPNTRVINDGPNPQFINRFPPPQNQNFSPNRFGPTNPPNHFNMGNNNRNQGYNNSPGLQYGQGVPRQFFGGQKFLPEYQPQSQQQSQQRQYPQQYQQQPYQAQQNNRQITPNNVNNRYQTKTNK